MSQLAICLLSLLVLSTRAAETPAPCFFPESELRPFFYDVDSDVAPWTAIAESIVDPPDARILLASVRAENPVGINFTERFTLVSSPTGRFALHSVLPLTLPPQINRTKLFVTVVCNDEAFALFTVRVTSIDNGNPQFYNEPYYVDVNEGLSVGETVLTPVVVIDWDSENTAPKLHIEGADSPFKIVTDGSNSSAAPVVKIGSNQTTTRQPTLVLLKLVKPIKHLPITLKLVAEKSRPLPLEHEGEKEGKEEQNSTASAPPPSVQQSEDSSRSEIGERHTTVEEENPAEVEEKRSSGGNSLEYSTEPSRRSGVEDRFSQGNELSEAKSREDPSSTQSSPLANGDSANPELPIIVRVDTTPRVQTLVENEHGNRSADEVPDSLPDESTRMPTEDTTTVERESTGAEKDSGSTSGVSLSSLEHSTTIAAEDTTVEDDKPLRPQNMELTDEISLSHHAITEEDGGSTGGTSLPPDDATTSLAEDATHTREPVETEQERGSTDGVPVPPTESSTTILTDDISPREREPERTEQRGESTDGLPLPSNEHSSATTQEDESLRLDQDRRSTNGVTVPPHKDSIGENGRDRATTGLETVEENAEQELSEPEQDGESTRRSSPYPDERSTAPPYPQAAEVPSIAEGEKSPEAEPDDKPSARSSLPPTEHSTDRPRKIAKARTRTPPRSSAAPLDDSATRFEQCAISVSMPENSEVGTLVTTLNVLNRKKWTMIDMVNPDGTFDINQSTGEVFIRDNRIMDRELFTQLELVAEIHGSSHMTECARVRVSVELLDENDNRPTFEKEMYNFLISDEFPVDDAVGIIRARDIDEGEAGRVTYRLLNESVPFALRKKGKDSEIFTTAELSTEIPVMVLVSSSGLKSTSSPATKKTTASARRKASGVVSATLEPLDLNVITDSSEVNHPLDDTTTTPAPSTSPPRRRVTTRKSSTPRSTTTTTSSATTAAPPTPAHPTLVSQEVFENETETTRGTTEASERDYSEDYSSESSERETSDSANNGSFAFVEPSYYFEVFGPPREGDLMGRVEARPRAQMYGLERTVAGAFKVDPDIGEISVGPALERLPNGNHSFHVSATDGERTAQTVVTIRLDTRRNRNDAVPRFERSRYVFRIAENRPPSVVGVVRAYHVSLSSNDVSLQYELINDFSSSSVPFRVHPLSGEVTSETTLDHEVNKNYEFKIRACLSVNPTNCGYTVVVVIVDDLNDNAPRFPASELRISLPSDLPTGSEVITLKATDADSGLNGDVNYAINPPSAVFGIDYHTGVVQTIAPLTESLYELDVEAFDHGDPKQTDVTRLIISVHGTNPSAPVFDQKRYEVTLSSPVRAGAVVAQLHAKDPDPGPEGLITYRFDNSSDTEQQRLSRKFSINEQTGVVSALEPLTADDGPFELAVVAEDQSTIFKRRAPAVLHIDVVGDTSLRFLPLPSTIYISTEKAVGSVVLRASAFTSSSTPVHFRVLENDAQFVMDGDLLRVATHLSEGETHLTVRAETEDAHSDHRLKVVVMFDRDKYPVFPQLTYDIDIPIDSVFPLIAHRFDAHLLNGTLRYRFFPDGTAPQGLHIHPDTGELSVTSDYASTPANHETQFVVVRAVNLNYPEFYSDVGVAISLVSSRTIRFQYSIYRMQITENLPVGTALFPPLEVFPKSSAVTYSINPPSPLSILENGTLVVNSPVDLETLPVDSVGNLHFVVTATLGGTQAVTKLQLKVKDLNEFAPQFERKLYEASIPEDATAGSVIVRVQATDADKSEGTHLLYKIVGGSGRELVFIQEDGTLILGDFKLDRETLTQFDVIVEAIDQSGNKDSTTVRVTVSDVNDNAPLFASKRMVWNVTEGSKDATFEVVATDKDSGRNGELEFQIIKGDPYHRFLIEKASAKSALLKLTGPLDHESRATYELTVEARDGGVPSRSSTAVVTVNVINRNDNPPIFQKMNYEQEVSSDLPIGYPIVTVAVNDADHDRLSFSLSGDPACSSLAVDPLGVVSFAKAVSKRTAGKITCIVSATDGVHTANATLRLNVFQSEQPTIETPQKNHAPRFSSEVYTVRIDPANGGQVLKKVKATDPDGDIISYSIEPPEFRNLFAVDAEGQVTARVPLHELKQSVYSFLVVAEDNGHPVMSSFTNIRVKVPENDNHVVTANSLEGTASTFTAPPSTIGSTTDKHSSAPPTDSTTEADTTTYAGDTSDLTSLSTIEKEEVTTTASTSEVTESAISFSRKKYTYAIRTGATVGTYLGHIEVNNGEGVKLVFRKNKQFVIDEQGWIHSAVPLSAPEKIEDDILAIKEGRTVATVPFMVHILPPDSASTLVPTSPEAERSTTADPTPTKTSDATAATQSVSTVGETASTASATFSTLTIETSASSDPSTAPTTGSTSDFTPSEQQPSLPTDASTTSSQFSFARSMYFAFVPEGQYTNGIRLAIKPEPLSVNRQTAVRYEIDDASQNIPFFITADGQLIIFDVDRESQASYMFTIKASSPEFGVAKATMNVTILDTNDNYPVFDASPSVIGLYRDAAVGTPLYHFSAHDQDADNYGAVTYGLEEHGSPFDINSNDGTLTVAHALDSTPEYSVTVFARDNGRPSLKSTQKITIQVFDPTVESPHFQKELPEKVVFFGTQPRSEIGTILAGPTITTKPNQDKILYGLVDDNSGLFAIEDGGRLVLARRPMDNEKNRYIQLNITAENSHGKDWTLLNVFVEGESTSTAPTSTTIDGEGNNSACYFPTKVYSTEFMENVRGRKRLLKVTSSCESEGRPYEYSFAYPSSEFELDAKTGEVFVKIPLDREQRSYHFLYINVSSPASTRARRVVRENPIIEQAKSSLTPTQTLVVVRVLDENDNAPAFLHGAEDDDTLVAAVDWQARLFTPVIRLEAKDADERPTLTYSISGTGSDYFLVNATSGLVILAKSIADYSGDSFQLTATVTDGLHIVPTPLRIYVISPSSSLVQLTAEVPHSEIDQRVVERTLNELNGLDNHLLAKQPFVDHQGHADPTRSHLFVYALDTKTRIPYLKEDLAKIMEHHAASLLSSPSRISEISLLSPPPTTFSAFDIVLAILVVLLLLLVFIACCILATYCKRKRAIATSDREYMVSSLAGPRPYDVEEVSRTTAQRVLSARPLPEPMTNQIEVAVSPIFMDDMVSTNKSDTTKAFSNSVRERPSLLQSALARQKVHASDVKPANSPHS
ncbi:hypothetical protein Y032_0367g37 [Ancylostoma ceylanicum]|uniref:Cadherin domain-containing protein n=1 Tax=Ancylostoma ceylanicum TaxID=53326 RepID=A0A016RUU7_9BILA|nr:hypothetical protein Y032_0367g37 [Ancylostoma ceylanicum]